MKSSEIARIQHVYQQYDQENLADKLWSPHNLGNQEIVRERHALLEHLLWAHGMLPLQGSRILEVGCGGGDVLASFIEWGAEARHLYGMELLSQRAAAAHERHPELQILQGNAAFPPLVSGAFDFIAFFTVFSSILDDSLRRQIAEESLQMLKPGGAIIWYDLRMPNPWNANLKPLRLADIAQLFPALTPALRSATLLPPLARRLGNLTRVVYPWLNTVGWLHTHYLGLLIDTRK